jgi:hypothetical protein
MDRDEQFLQEFYQALEDRPLDPEDREYVGLYDDPTLKLEDPVALLARSIEWAPSNSSAQLFSGFRGAGKSTELRRLRRNLTAQGYLVLLFDLFDYLSPSLPLDVSDFLMVLAGALSDQLEATGALKTNANSYWKRLTRFLRTRVEFTELVADLGPLEIKANLSEDPTFRERLQERAAGHLAALVKDVRTYMTEAIDAIPPQRLGKGVVLIADSIENVSGTLSNAHEVQESVERLFTSHAEQLHLPRVHAVYTAPPWLKIRAPGVSLRYSGGLQMLHPLTVSTGTREREPVPAALEALHKVVSARGDWQRLLGERATLDKLTLESGGHLRDLLRMLGEILRRADRLPVDQRTVQRAIMQMRSDLLPIAEDDAVWLQRIAETHEVSLADIERLPRLVTFLDSHLVLCYRNGEEWYDVHPLVREEVEQIVAVRAAADAAGAQSDSGVATARAETEEAQSTSGIAAAAETEAAQSDSGVAAATADS